MDVTKNVVLTPSFPFSSIDMRGKEKKENSRVIGIVPHSLRRKLHGVDVRCIFKVTKCVTALVPPATDVATDQAHPQALRLATIAFGLDRRPISVARRSL
jgi:hypothetical protein